MVSILNEIIEEGKREINTNRYSKAYVNDNDLDWQSLCRAVNIAQRLMQVPQCHYDASEWGKQKTANRSTIDVKRNGAALASDLEAVFEARTDVYASEIVSQAKFETLNPRVQGRLNAKHPGLYKWTPPKKQKGSHLDSRCLQCGVDRRSDNHARHFTQKRHRDCLKRLIVNENGDGTYRCLTCDARYHEIDALVSHC